MGARRFTVDRPCGLFLLSVAALAAGCEHRALRPAGPAADAGLAPDAADAAPTPPDAASSADGRRDGGNPDVTTVTSDCGSLVSFHVEPDPSVDPSTLCPLECGGPLATLTSGTTQFQAGTWLNLSVPVVWVTPGRINGCVLSCDTCEMVFCHSCIVLSTFPTVGFDTAWDGSYFAQGTCNGNACMGPIVCAPVGHWSARFCMQRGVTVAGPYGSGGCIPLSKLDPSATHPEACGTAEFDLPSAASVSVKMHSSAGIRVPLDPGLASTILGFAGSYRLSPSSGGSTASQSGSTKVQFADSALALASAIDSDVVIVTNPLPGDFPGSCTIPLNVAMDGTGGWSLQNPATTCAADGAIVTLYPGYYTVSPLGSNLAVVAAGSSTGGLLSAAETFAFAYSGLATRSP
jgi:hypothetical protein